LGRREWIPRRDHLRMKEVSGDIERGAITCLVVDRNERKKKMRGDVVVRRKNCLF
jgi:hypothetical protein